MKHLRPKQETTLSYQNQLDTLIDLRLASCLTKKEYEDERAKLLKQINQLRERIKVSEEHWKDVAEIAFDFATHANEIFQKGDTKTKRAIVMALGQNYTMKDRILNLELNPLLRPVEFYAEH